MHGREKPVAGAYREGRPDLTSVITKRLKSGAIAKYARASPVRLRDGRGEIVEIELSTQSHELPLGKSVLLEELGDDLQVPLVTHRFKLDEIEAA
jgi:hypothetical protein